MNYLMLPQALRTKIAQIRKSTSNLQPSNPLPKTPHQPSKPVSVDNAAGIVVDAKLSRRTMADLPFQLRTKQQTFSKHVPSNIYDIYGVKSSGGNENKVKKNFVN